jgi:hypothetical protein
MAEKSKMKCNRVVASDRPGKKRMVKACEGGKEKLIHFGAKGYGQSQNLPQDIGRVKVYGRVKVVARSHHQKIVKENISIFVKTFNNG